LDRIRRVILGGLPAEAGENRLGENGQHDEVYPKITLRMPKKYKTKKKKKKKNTTTTHKKKKKKTLTHQKKTHQNTSLKDTPPNGSPDRKTRGFGEGGVV